MQRIEVMGAQRPRTKITQDPGVLLVGSMLLAAWICFAQIRGSTMLLSGGLLLFLLFTVWASDVGMAFPVLLFFLPWSPLLKLYRGGTSFFTIAMLACCGMSLLKHRFMIQRYQLILSAVLLALTLLAKMLFGNELSNSYLFFFAMLVLFPCLAAERDHAFDFWQLTLFFSIGIISAALSARQAAGYANISKYIKVDSYLSITRLSGYYGDPNFYSAHVTACLAGAMLLLSHEKHKGRRLVLALVAIMLLYCGLLSASKSFVLVVACLFFVWVFVLMERDQRGSTRIRILLGVLCAGAIVLSASGFRQAFQILDDRFAYASNLSQLTTGRTDLWVKYLRLFSHNALVTLFGEGYSAVTLNGRASHNTLIQGIYQFGVLGFPLVLTWMGLTLKRVFAGRPGRSVDRMQLLLLCIGVVLPWMGLDILFFDEFFLLPLYIAMGCLYTMAD